MKSMRVKLWACLTAGVLTAGAVPVIAVHAVNEYSRHMLKADPDSLAEEKVYTGVQYFLTDHNQTAFGFNEGGLVWASADETGDGIHYLALSDDFTDLYWVLANASSGSGCVLHVGDAEGKMLCYDGSDFTLTDEESKALTVGFDIQNSAAQVAVYSSALGAYLSWENQKLTLSEKKCTVEFCRKAKTAQAGFYYADGGTTAKQYETVTYWVGDDFTLPELPDAERPGNWNQIDPLNNNAVLGTYAPGDAVTGTDGTMYFLAQYKQEQAVMTTIGMGKKQTLTFKTGQTADISVGENAPVNYLLYDSQGNAQALRAESGKLTVQITDSEMYLCACDDSSEDAVRISTVDDLLLMRKIINGAAKVQDYALMLTADLDLSDVCGAGQESWEPIAPARDGQPGAGNIRIYGKKHTVSGLYQVSGDSGCGFFGYAASLTGIGLTLKGTVSGAGSAGLLISECDSMNLVGCGVSADVASDTAAGGFAGAVHGKAQLTLSYASGSVSSGQKTAGMFFGTAESAVVAGCHMIGQIAETAAESSLGSCASAEIRDTWVCSGMHSKDADSGLQIVSAEEFADGTVLTALNMLSKVWAQGPEYPVFTGGKYKLNVDYDTAGGSLSFASTVGTAGEEVTFEAKASEGYTMQFSAVTAVSGRSIAVTDSEEGVHTFLMPGEDVNISIRFIKDEQSESKLKWGDVDLNGKVNIADAILLAQFNAEISGTRLDGDAIENADCDGNGKIDAYDNTLLLEYIAGMVTVTPADAA